MVKGESLKTRQQSGFKVLNPRGTFDILLTQLKTVSLYLFKKFEPINFSRTT